MFTLHLQCYYIVVNVDRVTCSVLGVCTCCWYVYLVAPRCCIDVAVYVVCFTHCPLHSYASVVTLF